MEPEGALISKGAESYIYLVNWYGYKSIKKQRVSKKYRHPKLDEMLRKSRTRREAKLLSEVKKYGVSAPTLYAYYPSEYTIIMEYVEGVLLRESLRKDSMERKYEVEIFEKLGEMIASLHSNGVVHGDLTTSNVIILSPQDIVLIDFGLGLYTQSIEDFGIEIRVFYNALKSTHYDKVDYLFPAFIESYKKHFEFGEKVYRKFKEISMRGRYIEERRKRKFTQSY